MAVEAKSLSSLTALASNPPPYPRDPSHPRNEQLVLYISRVPGSKDVFLTPIKPRQKVVTAEDIESSLYYLHVHCPEDEQLLASIENAEDSAPESPISRLHPGDSIPHRKPLSRPLPPVPQEHGTSPPRLYLPEDRNPYGYVRPEIHEPEPPPLPPRPENSPPGPNSENTTRLTLIRRDPASSVQWNVADIKDIPVFEVTNDGRRNSMTSTKIRKSGQPLYIEINNPGYAKFTNSANESLASPTRSTPSLTDASSASGSILNDTTFKRRMWMEGSIFETQQRGHRKAISSEMGESAHLTRPSFDARSSSEFSLNTTNRGLTRDPIMHRISIDGDRKRSKNRGYTLMSPWKGRCEFSSGIGNALKCKHSLPTNGLRTQAAPALVSELHFNLPGGGPMAKTIPTSPAPDSSSKRSRFLRSSRQNLSSSSIDLARSQFDSLDLSLGQELAGGGFAGKQAKLGKLIIEDEGLKMMDLLVAANLGLWWRAYEKG